MSMLVVSVVSVCALCVCTVEAGDRCLYTVECCCYRRFSIPVYSRPESIFLFLLISFSKIFFSFSVCTPRPGPALSFV